MKQNICKSRLFGFNRTYISAALHCIFFLLLKSSPVFHFLCSVSPTTDARQQAAPSQRLLPLQRFQSSLQILYQPAGGDGAFLSEPWRICYRPIHLRTSQGVRLPPQGFLREEEHFGVSFSLRSIFRSFYV